MAWTKERPVNAHLSTYIQQILASQQVRRSEYIQLMTALLSEQLVSDFERHQINTIFDGVKTRQIKIVD